MLSMEELLLNSYKSLLFMSFSFAIYKDFLLSFRQPTKEAATAAGPTGETGRDGQVESVQQQPGEASTVHLWPGRHQPLRLPEGGLPFKLSGFIVMTYIHNLTIFL